MSICPTCGRSMPKLKIEGNELRKFRTSKGLSLTDVHKGTKITKSMLSRLERKENRAEPSLSTMLKLCDFYEIDLIHLAALLG